MHVPFRRSKPKSMRMLQMAAMAAGMARLALRQRTLRPHVAKRDSGNRLTRALKRS